MNTTHSFHPLHEHRNCRSNIEATPFSLVCHLQDVTSKPIVIVINKWRLTTSVKSHCKWEVLSFVLSRSSAPSSLAVQQRLESASLSTPQLCARPPLCLTLVGPHRITPPLACSSTRGGPFLDSATSPRTRSSFDDSESEPNADDLGTSPEIRFPEGSSFKSCNRFPISGGSSSVNRFLMSSSFCSPMNSPSVASASSSNPPRVLRSTSSSTWNTSSMEPRGR
jgi:hypothetical protein